MDMDRYLYEDKRKLVKMLLQVKFIILTLKGNIMISAYILCFSAPLNVILKVIWLGKIIRLAQTSI